MKNTDGLFTDGDTDFTPKVSSIPLSDVDTRAAGKGSIGQLVGDATAQVSQLVRGEIELAKAELAQEAKKGAIGGASFIVAGILALYSTFFLFFSAAWLLDHWLPRSLAFFIVFAVLIILAGLIAFFGFKKLKKIGKPQKTIDSVGELKKLVPGKAEDNFKKSTNPGMFS